MTISLSTNPALPSFATGSDALVCIAWIDAHSFTRECLTQSVGHAQPLFIIVPFESVCDCIKASERKIDLIVYHAHESDTVNVADLETLREAFGSTRLVVLSDASVLDPAAVEEVLRRGASGFILTSKTGFQTMVSALALVASGGIFVPKEFLLHRADASPPAARHYQSRAGQLTSRELQVLGLLKQGKPNKLIAFELKLSEATVKIHIRNTMRKMGSTNRTHAAMHADRYLQSNAA